MNTIFGEYRVLDLTDEKGFFCGKLLGDLGADVIKIEKPGGDPARSRGAFFNDIVNQDRNIYWWAWNTSKRGITLDIEKKEGREIFIQLVRSADFVIESFPPGYLDRLGIGFAELSKINQRLIFTSITPFGQVGPYKHYQASDLTLMAMGGVMSRTGKPDGPPERLYLDQSYTIAGVHVAVGCLSAHYNRLLSGQGQRVDVSIQECVIDVLSLEVAFWDFEKRVMGRSGNRWIRGNAAGRVIWPCKDGYISWILFGGAAGEQENQKLAEWIAEEGITDSLCQVDWGKVDYQMLTQEELLVWEQWIESFFRRHTKLELEEQAWKRGIRLLGLRTVKEVVEGEHFKLRGFWANVAHPELDLKFKYPGRIMEGNNTENKVRRRAPLIGEHNSEVYGEELGFAEKELTRLKRLEVI